MCEKWISPPYCDYFDSRGVDKHPLDCEKAMCTEKPWQVSLRHAQIFLVTERNTNQDYVLHSHIQTAGISSSEVSGKIVLFKDVTSSLCVLCNYQDLWFQKTISCEGMQLWPE